MEFVQLGDKPDGMTVSSFTPVSLAPGARVCLDPEVIDYAAATATQASTGNKRSGGRPRYTGRALLLLQIGGEVRDVDCDGWRIGHRSLNC